MYRCTCVYIVHIHRLVCIDVHTHMHMQTCIYTYTHMYTCVYTHHTYKSVYMWTCACICMCLCRCLSAHVCVYIGVYMYIYILTDIHVHTQEETHTHACVCVCVLCRHTRPYILGKHKHIAKGAFLSKTDRGVRQLNLQKGNNPWWAKWAGGPNKHLHSNKGRRDRHIEAQGRKQINSRTGLGWAGAARGWGWGQAHRSTPGHLSGQWYF